jgi:hypothetical protein
LKRKQGSIRLQERVLHQIFCIRLVARVSQGQPHDACPVFAIQRIECPVIAGLRPPNELFIERIRLLQHFQYF